MTLHEKRIYKRVPIYYIADALGISITYYKNLERGKINLPMILAKRLARFYHCSTNEIYEMKMLGEKNRENKI